MTLDCRLVGLSDAIIIDVLDRRRHLFLNLGNHGGDGADQVVYIEGALLAASKFDWLAQHSVLDILVDLRSRIPELQRIILADHVGCRRNDPLAIVEQFLGKRIGLVTENAI